MRNRTGLDLYVLRKTTPQDVELTESLTREAFWDRFQPGAVEHLVLWQLRASPEYLPEMDIVLTDEAGEILGQILLTRAQVEQEPELGKMLLLAPLSVLPGHQGHGVGGALIRYAVQRAKEAGYRGIALFGHPGYYPRFGFRNAEVFGITTQEGENFEAFMVLPLYEDALNGYAGKLTYSNAFHTTEEDLVAFDKRFPAKEKRFQEKGDAHH